MRISRLLVLIAATTLLAAGCGDKDGGSGGALTIERCVDLTVNAMNDLDFGGINVSDGLDQTESDKISALSEQFEDDNPALDTDGQCDDLFSDATPEQQQSIFSVIGEKIDPEKLEILGES